MNENKETLQLFVHTGSETWNTHKFEHSCTHTPRTKKHFNCLSTQEVKLGTHINLNIHVHTHLETSPCFEATVVDKLK